MYHPVLDVHEDSDVTSSDSNDDSLIEETQGQSQGHTDITDAPAATGLLSPSTMRNEAAQNRTKRQIPWCGTDLEDHFLPIPPPSSSSSSLAYSSVSGGEGRNWNRGIRMQLYCRVGHFLAIYPDGKVRGTQDANDLHTFVEMISIGHPGHVVIRGVLSNLYVVMTRKGRLRAQLLQGNRNIDAAVFLEGVLGFYMTYLSRHYAHAGWYLGLKKSGKFKNGRKTKMYQKAVHFMKRYK